MHLVLLNNYSNAVKTQETLRSLSRIVGERIQLEDYRTAGLYEKITRSPPDLLILSGSGHMLTKPENQRAFAPVMEIIRDTDCSILGICYGHQLIGKTFGARLTDLGKTCKGFERVKLLKDSPMFYGLANEIRVPESHRQALVNVPVDFDCLGESTSSKVEIIAHKSRPIYGFQFHPERANDEHPDGEVLLRNLTRLALKK